MLHKLSKRSFFIGSASIIASPAIIRVAQLMQIKPEKLITISYKPVWEMTPEELTIGARSAYERGQFTEYRELHEMLQFSKICPPSPALAQAIPVAS